MSQRHRTTAEVPLPPKQELRAHAHSERQRMRVEEARYTGTDDKGEAVKLLWSLKKPGT